MHNYLVDKHKQWIMKGWHAICLRSPLIGEELIGSNRRNPEIDRNEALKTPDTAFSQSPVEEVQGLSMAVYAEWIINFFETRGRKSAEFERFARESEIIRKTHRTAGADGEQLSQVEKAVALTKLYLELSLPLPDALRAAEADL
jgi:hypothetical protein